MGGRSQRWGRACQTPCPRGRHGVRFWRKGPQILFLPALSSGAADMSSVVSSWGLKWTLLARVPNWWQCLGTRRMLALGCTSTPVLIYTDLSFRGP